MVRRLDALAARAGRPRAARTQGTSPRFCRPSPAGAAGRTGRRKSTGRSFPATALRNSIPRMRCRILKCTGVVNIVSFEGKPAPIPEYELDSIRAARRQRAAVRSLSDDSRRHDGRSRPRSAARRHRPAAAEGRIEGASGAVGRSDRPGRERRSRRRRRQALLARARIPQRGDRGARRRRRRRPRSSPGGRPAAVEPLTGESRPSRHRRWSGRRRRRCVAGTASPSPSSARREQGREPPVFHKMQELVPDAPRSPAGTGSDCDDK